MTLFNGNSLRNVLVGTVLMMIGAMGALFITVKGHTEQITALQAKTAMMPPADYRAWIDVQFTGIGTQVEKNADILRENGEVLAEVLAEIRADVRTHLRDQAR